MVVTYLELPYPFESYSVGIDVVLEERGISADALVAAVLAGGCSADDSSTRYGLVEGSVTLDGLVVADSVRGDEELVRSIKGRSSSL